MLYILLETYWCGYRISVLIGLYREMCTFDHTQILYRSLCKKKECQHIGNWLLQVLFYRKMEYINIFFGNYQLNYTLLKYMKGLTFHNHFIFPVIYVTHIPFLKDVIGSKVMLYVLYVLYHMFPMLFFFIFYQKHFFNEKLDSRLFCFRAMHLVLLFWNPQLHVSIGLTWWILKLIATLVNV